MDLEIIVRVFIGNGLFINRLNGSFVVVRGVLYLIYMYIYLVSIVEKN